MERITKKDFFRKYASKKEKDNIKSAAILTYICAAVSLGFGIFIHNYSAAIDVVLIVCFALGIQIAKSRVCAVLLLIYSCINGAVTIIDTGRMSGWWMILVGIWAVRGTFNLQKEYKKFLQDGTIPEQIQQQTQRQIQLEPATKEKVVTGQLIATILPFAGMFLGMFIIWFSISPAFMEILVGGAKSPEELLQGYGVWYMAIIGAVAAAILLAAAGVVISAWKGMRTPKSMMLMALSLAFPIFFGGFMVVSEKVPALFLQADEDMGQLKRGQLQEVTVWLSPKSRAARLPGPYGEGQPEPVTRYGGISHETDGIWVEFYVPDSLDFSLDQNALYNENMSISWNEEHARKYRIRYTENLHLAVSVEPVDNIEEFSQPEQ